MLGLGQYESGSLNHLAGVSEIITPEIAKTILQQSEGR